MIQLINNIFNLYQVSSKIEFTWEVLEFIILILFIFQGIYFLIKFFKEKKKNLKSLSQIDLGYSIFFFATALNQLVYLFDANVFGWFPNANFFISNGEFNVYIYISNIELGLKNQIILMILLFFYSFVPITYPLEKYIQQKQKLTKFKFSLLITIILTIFYLVIFVLGRYLSTEGFKGIQIKWSGEINTIGGNILNIIIIIIAILTLISYFQLLINFIGNYIIIAKNSPKGALKTKSLSIFFGFLLFYTALIAGNGFKGELENVLNGWGILIGPIGFILGNFILIYGFNKKVI